MLIHSMWTGLLWVNRTFLCIYSSIHFFSDFLYMFSVFCTIILYEFLYVHFWKNYYMVLYMRSESVILIEIFS